MFTSYSNMLWSTSRISFLFIALLVIPTRAFAADYLWTNPAGGSYSTPGNWSPSGPPPAGSNVIFNLGSLTGYSVSGNSTAASTNIRINNDTLTGLFDATTLSVGYAPSSQGLLSLNGKSLNVNVDASAAAGGLTVGVDGSGTLTESSAQVNVEGHLLVAQNADSQGTITLDRSSLGTPGFGSKLDLTSATIGASGTATLSAVNGSTVNLGGPFIAAQNAGSQATITLNGSTLGTPGFGTQTELTSTTIGLGGTATLSATNQSAVDLNGTFMVGQNAGSQGAVTVDNSRIGAPGDGGLHLTSTTIGGAGTGSLSVIDGSRANLSGSFTVGQSAGSQGTVLVDGANSILGVPGFGSYDFGPTTIGAGGNGSVSITNGGTFYANGSFVIGQDSGSQGSMSVSGAGSQLTPPGFGSNALTSFTIGASGNGSLSITKGGVVNLPTTVVIGQNAGSQGSLDIDGAGSKFQANGLSVGGTSSSGGTGILTISNGGQASISTTSVNALGQVDIASGKLTSVVTNAGMFTDDGSVIGSLLNANGGFLSGTGNIVGTLTLLSGSTVQPGDAPGTLTVGSFVSGATGVTNAGTFRFEIDSAQGTAGNSVGWNLLKSTGAATLHGTMTLDLVSLTQADGAGKVFDFDPTQNYHWTFLTAGGISGFNPANFAIDTTGFANPIYGTFSVSEVGNSLVLNYKAPEPSTLVLAALGGLALLAHRVRRR